MTSDVTWIAGRSLVGFRRKSIGDGENTAETWIPGEVIACRKNGDELLFADTPELSDDVAPKDVPKAPVAWIKVEDFSANPLCLVYAEDFLVDEEGEPGPGSFRSVPAKGGGDPLPPRRRGK